jgi:hypothetical protein
MSRSGVVFDAITSVIRGLPVDAELLRRATEAPVATWQRVLGFEGCAPQFDRELRSRGLMAMVPTELRQMLRESTASALRLGLLAHRQLGEIAALAGRHEIRVMAVKGAAQLLAGQVPGARSLSDIDLLVRPADGERFHALLASELGYTSEGRAYPHHLPVLERPASLNLDVHVRLSDMPIALDDAIWTDTRTVSIDGSLIALPSSTNMVLHALEHGLRLNWMGRYRLRDVLDVAALYTADVSNPQVSAYVAESGVRRACETLLSAAHALEPRVPVFRATAWRTIRRVSRTRLALAVVPRDPRMAERCFRYAGLVAEGSAGSMLRAGRNVVSRLASAVLRAAA